MTVESDLNHANRTHSGRVRVDFSGRHDWHNALIFIFHDDQVVQLPNDSIISVERKIYDSAIGTIAVTFQI